MARLVREESENQYLLLLQQAITANPDDPAAFIELGSHFKQIGNAVEAQGYLIQAYDLDPTNIGLLVSLAENSAVLGDTPAAIDYWQAVAFRNERRRPEAYYQIGDLALMDNNLTSALAFFRKAVELEPESIQYQMALAQTYFGLGCRQEAIDAFQNVLEQADSEEIIQEAQDKLADLVEMQRRPTPCPNGS